MSSKKTDLTLDDLTAKVKSLVGKDRLISIAYSSQSPKQAADVARRLGLNEDVVKKIRYAGVIKRDYGIDQFNLIFQPYSLVQVPKAFSGANITLSVNDGNKRADDFLNSKELLYVLENFEKFCESNNINIKYNKPNIQRLKQSAPSWLGNRILKEYSEG